jgi:hypothetical protein
MTSIASTASHRHSTDAISPRLEEASKVAKKTIADFERGARSPYPRTLADHRQALEAAA